MLIDIYDCYDNGNVKSISEIRVFISWVKYLLFFHLEIPKFYGHLCNNFASYPDMLCCYFA